MSPGELKLDIHVLDLALRKIKINDVVSFLNDVPYGKRNIDDTELKMDTDDH